VSILDQFKEKSKHPATKNEALQGFEQRWGVNWKEEATAYLAGTRDKKSRAWKSASRNFQKRATQKTNPDKPTKKWREVGKDFLLRPKGGYRVQGTIVMQISKARHLKRKVNLVITDKNALQLTDSELAQIIIDQYMGKDTDASPDDESEWKLTVDPIE